MLSRRAKLAPAEPYGVRWYVGVPQSGKTTGALAHFAKLCSSTGNPGLVVDSDEVSQLAGVPRVASVDAAIASLWKHRRSCSIAPSSLAEVDAICAAVRAGKDVNVLVDEAHNWLSAQSGSSAALIGLMRKTQHARCHVLLTTQHLTGDVPQAALSCAPTLFVFRCTGAAVLKTLKATYGIAPELVASLPQHAFIRHRTGF